MYTIACLDAEGRVLSSCVMPTRTFAMQLFGAALLTEWRRYPDAMYEIVLFDPAGHRMLWETRPATDDPNREAPF